MGTYRFTGRVQQSGAQKNRRNKRHAVLSETIPRTLQRHSYLRFLRFAGAPHTANHEKPGSQRPDLNILPGFLPAYGLMPADRDKSPTTWSPFPALESTDSPMILTPRDQNSDLMVARYYFHASGHDVMDHCHPGSETAPPTSPFCRSTRSSFPLPSPKDRVPSGLPGLLRITLPWRSRFLSWRPESVASDGRVGGEVVGDLVVGGRRGCREAGLHA